MPIIRSQVHHDVSFRRYLSHIKCRAINTIKDRNVMQVCSGVDSAFIVGCGHSGTTLLASRLGQHPRVELIPMETSWYLPQQSLKNTRNSMLVKLQEAEAKDCVVLLEKTPKHIHCWRRILRVHSNALFIGIVRNPLDNIASLYKRFNDLDFCCARYQMDNQALLDLSKREFCLLVRFEDLIISPEKVLSASLGWLGCSWDEKVLENKTSYRVKENSKENQKRRFAQVAGPIRRNLGSFADVLTEYQIKKTMSMVGDIATAFGYSLPV